MSNHDREGSRPSRSDADLARAWHEASDEQPPAHLDAAIIAAARKSVPEHGEQPNAARGRAHSRNWLMQWQPLAAAATVAGLAFVLVQMLPRDATDDSQLPSADRKVAPPERVAVPHRGPAQGIVPAPPAVTAEASVSQPGIRREGAVSETAESTDAVTASGEVSADRREAVEPAMAGRAATAPAVATASVAREKNLGKAASLDAAAWAAKIGSLHGSGDVAAAEQSLRAFRAAEPAADTYLPESLRDWARTVE